MLFLSGLFGVIVCRVLLNILSRASPVFYRCRKQAQAQTEKVSWPGRQKPTRQLLLPASWTRARGDVEISMTTQAFGLCIALLGSLPVANDGVTKF
jgi:hypothetical protein